MGGIRRKLDEMGRVIIPIGMRKELNYAKNQPIMIDVIDGRIIIEKTSEACDLCGGEDRLISRGRYLLCSKCYCEIMKA